MISSLQKLYKSQWFFPVLCFALFVILVSFKLNGSSIGFYNQFFYGNPEYKDSQLLANHPRGVRSDEFLVITPGTISQSQQDYPQQNDRIGQGQDMSTVIDTPYKDWSTFFKPQHWSFFVLPLEYAFAFKWWLLALMLVISCYFFTLSLLPQRRLWAALIAIAVLFAPFVQWWYQTITIAPLAYGFLLLSVGMRFFRPRLSWLTRVGLGALFTYLLAAFALVLYPPFQIPVALAVAVFMIGYILDKRNALGTKALLSSLAALAGSAVLAGLVVILFLKTRSDVIHALQHTAYPGNRQVATGGFGFRRFFGSHLAVFLQSDTRAAHYLANQSEASSFLATQPFIALASAVSLVKNRARKQPLFWTTIGCNTVLLVLLAGLFIPALDPLYAVLQLDSIPQARLLLGIGFVGALQLVLFLHSSKQSYTLGWRIAISVLAGGSALAAALGLRHEFPGFVSNLPVITLLSGAFGLLLWLLMGRKRQITLGLMLLAGLSFMASCNVNPLYQGLQGPLETPIKQAMAETGSPDDVWAVADNRALVNLPLLYDKRALTGVYTYPQPALWQSLAGDKSDTYNRYAHAILTLDQPITSSASHVELKADDYFTVHASPCADYLRQQQVRYILTSTKLPASECLSAERSVTYPNVTLYIYKVE